MDLTEKLARVDLHDSSVAEMTFAPAKHELKLYVDLCAWRQEGAALGIARCLVAFTGVTSLSFIPCKAEPLGHSEILEVKVTPECPEHLYRIRFVLAPAEDGSDVAILDVTASDVVISADHLED